MNELTERSTLSSLEVAEMMEINHWEVLRKLDGTDKSKGIIPILTDNKIVVSEYFIESSYRDASGKVNKCYDLTKMGCEFLANKYNGEKGILFTAKYVKRFNEMEKHISAPSYMIEDPVQRAEKWIQEAKEKQLLLVANNHKDQIIGELKPKADYTDSILKSKSIVNTNQIAKDYGLSATALNKKLNELGVQYKQGEQWLLYSKYHAKGYTHSETTNITRSSGTPDTIMRTKWTQKGRLFIYNLLKQQGILPMIEREDIA